MNEEIEGVKISELPKASNVSPTDVVAGVVNNKTSGIPLSLLTTTSETLTIVEFNNLWDAAP